MILYIIIFAILVLFSAFFSSAETSLLSLNSIRLKHKAKKRDKKAKLLLKILKSPEEFFSTILIGNNIVNIFAASISTVFFTRIFFKNEKMILLSSTLFTTIIILFFAEIIPKSYAFRYSEKLSSYYAYPIKFFSFLFFPFVKIFTFLSNLLLDKGERREKKDLTTEELKHFLSTEVAMFKYNPDSLEMLNEILDIGKRDVKSIMTPRMDMIAIDIDSGEKEFRKIITSAGVSRLPIFKNTLDSIKGIFNLKKNLPMLIREGIIKEKIVRRAEKPFFISEYSSLNYVLKEFRENGKEMAIVLDEYGATIGLLTLNDIFSEILGEIEIESEEITEISGNIFMIKGSVPVEEINYKLDTDLPQKKDYSTFSGLFVFHFGKLPGKGDSIVLGRCRLTVEKMGKRKIDELRLELKESR